MRGVLGCLEILFVSVILCIECVFLLSCLVSVVLPLSYFAYKMTLRLMVRLVSPFLFPSVGRVLMLHARHLFALDKTSTNSTIPPESVLCAG